MLYTSLSSITSAMLCYLYVIAYFLFCYSSDDSYVYNKIVVDDWSHSRVT